MRHYIAPTVAAGTRFTRWTVLGRDPDCAHRLLCRCECGTTRSIPAHKLVIGQSKSCGCGRQPLPIDRLMGKFVVDPSGCWILRGKSDYGSIRFNGKRLGAHVASYLLFVGPIPEGHWVLHKCDNRRCVNPDHLFTGTPKRNTWDMIEKGRNIAAVRPDWAPRGEKVHTARLTEEQVVSIRTEAMSGAGMRVLGRKYGMDHKTICAIVSGKTWKHVK